MISVSPHIVVPDASQASTSYTRAFQEISRVPLPGDRAMSVQVQIGPSTIHLGSEFPAAGILSPSSTGGTPTVLQITTEDAPAFWRHALAARAEQRHPLAEQFCGDLDGQLTDSFGHRWNIPQKIRAVSPEKIAAAAVAIFDHPASDSTSSDG